MMINGRKLYNFIEIYNAVNRHNRKLQPEGGKKAKRYRKAPHSADVSLHIKFRIASGTKDTPSRTVVLTDCAIRFRPQKRSMYCRYSAAVSESGAK